MAGLSYLNQQKIQEFEAILSSRSLSPSSKKIYLFHLNKFFEFAGDLPYTQVNKMHLASFLNDSDKQIEKNSVDWEVKRRQLSPKTKMLIVSILHSFYDQIGEEKIAKDIKSLLGRGSKERGSRLPVHLNEQEIEALIKADILENDLLNSRNRIIAAFLVSTGVRANELCNLKVVDLKLEEKFTGDRKLIHVIGKGNKERKILVPRWWLEVYREYRQTSHDTSNFLFSSKKSDHLSPHTIWSIIKIKASKARIAGEKIQGVMHNDRLVYPHNLRSTFISELGVQNVDLFVRQELAGHASSETTRLYSTISDKQLLAAKTRDRPEGV